MAQSWLDESRKKARYGQSFLRGNLVHTNLQLLYDCNLRCQICDFWKADYKDRPRLSLEQVRVIAQKLDEIGPQIISIGGGEPLMHQEIIPIVEALSPRHFPVMICNGWFVTKEKARAIFEAGIYEVSVSLDYANAEKHDTQRGVKGAFDRAVAALRLLQENRVKPWQRVHMISVVMDDNVDEIESLLKLSKELEVSYVVTLHSDHRGELPNRTRDTTLSNRLLELKDKYPEFVQLRGYLARFSEAVKHHGIGPCHAGKNLCNIDSQGNVTLCIDRLEDPVGNILEDPSFMIRDRLLRKFETNSCRACWTSCRGSIETLMYGKDRLSNLRDYYQLTKSIPLKATQL